MKQLNANIFGVLESKREGDWEYKLWTKINKTISIICPNYSWKIIVTGFDYKISQNNINYI